MKLSEVKESLKGLESLHFQLKNGSKIPDHFHVTEIGKIEKTFIDCGGVLRKENRITFQLWYSIDINHRLEGAKLLSIIEMAEEKLHLEDADIEVEYQQATIGKFGLSFSQGTFILEPLSTACLAEDSCGIPINKVKRTLQSLTTTTACAPGGNCC